jgi:hypothetical protein
MDSKIVTLFLIGIIVGGGAGYFGAYSTSSTRIAGYEEQLKTLTAKIGENEAKIADLTTTYDGLNQQFTTLKTQNDGLQLDYGALQQQAQQFSEAKDQLQAEYDTLYTKYQSLIGGPIGSAGDSIAKTYIWSFGGKVWTVELQVPRATLDYFRDHARLNGADYSVYVTNAADDAYMTGVANKLHILASQEGYTGAREVNFVASFVQNMPYEFDNVTTGYQEYARYPIETLADGRGDCECKAILTAELLDLLGYKLAMIDLPEHVAVGVYLPNGSGSYYSKAGVDYFYLETTHTGWLVGDMPPVYNGVSATLYPVVPVAIVSLSFTYKYVGARYTVNATVYNKGTATASGYTVVAGFDAGGGMIWSRTESLKFDVASDSKRSIILTLDAPSSKYTRLVVFLVSPEGYSVETQYSGWFNS